MFWTLSFVLGLVAASHQFNITKFSVPAAVEVDADAELTCEHDAAAAITKWWWRPTDSDPYLLYQHVPGADSRQQIITPDTEPFFNITIKTKGEDNLILGDLQPAHSGVFACEVFEDGGDYQEMRYHSDMVVYSIGDGPELSFEGEEEVLVTCAAAGVAPEPDIFLSYDSNTFNTTIRLGPIDGLYNVSTNATLLRQDIEGAEISCRLSFKDSDILPTSQMEVSDTFHSDAWLASTTAAPDEAAEVQATLESTQSMPDSAGRADGAWAALAALTLSLHLRAMF